MYDFGFNIWSVVSTVLNVLLGGGFIVTVITLKSQKKRVSGEADQAAALADSTELDNVEKAISIWREMAESLKGELAATKDKSDLMAEQIELLRKEIGRLTKTSNRIISLLDNINHENFEKMVEKIKSEIQS